MLISDISTIVLHGADELGVPISPGAIAAFCKYNELLELRGEYVNLTAITGACDVARLHFLDSLALLNATRFAGARVIDIGSGAGFPGVPLKIVERSISLTLLDASGKRVAFTTELCDALELDAICIHARAEDAARYPDLREQYDIAVTRAVARLNILCELCLPFVSVGGLFIAMKGPDSADELSEAGDAIVALGAKMHKCYDYTIPGTDITHRVVLIHKIAKTPEKYPRRFARIKSAPL